MGAPYGLECDSLCTDVTQRADILSEFAVKTSGTSRLDLRFNLQEVKGAFSESCTSFREIKPFVRELIIVLSDDRKRTAKATMCAQTIVAD